MMNRITLVYLFSIVFMASCGSHSKNPPATNAGFETDSISVKLKYAETSFIVPSPEQTSLLLKRCNIGFYDDLPAGFGSADKLTTTFKKSLALGVLGADLSYLNLYNQREMATKYLQQVQSLLSDLEVSFPVDKDDLQRIEENFGNNDSVLYYLGNLYRHADQYLKANDRRDIGSLIIAGGWIESFYFLTAIYDRTHRNEIFTLILYQSDILDNLIKLLAPFYEKSPDFTKLIDGLVNTAYAFDVVDKIQTTTTAETDRKRNLTLVNNQTRHLLTGSKLDDLKTIAGDLRNRMLLQ